MRKGQCCFATLVLIGLLLSTSACEQSAQVASAPPGATKGGVPHSSSPPTPLGGASAKLGPLPGNCPAGPAPQAIPQISSAIGSSPVWAAFSKAPLTLVWTLDDAARFHTSDGWSHKFLWIVDANYKGLITLQGANLQNSSPLLPVADTAAQGSTRTTLILNPQDPYVPQGRQVGHWIEFPGGLTVPEAGCYYLKASWPGGEWLVDFAAGEVTTYTL